MTRTCSNCPKRATCTITSPEDCADLAKAVEPPIDIELQAPFRDEIPSKALTETGWCDPSYKKDSNHTRPAPPPTVDADEARWCMGVSRELQLGLHHIVEQLAPKQRQYVEAWMRFADVGNMVPYQAVADEAGVARQTVRKAILAAMKRLRVMATEKLPKHLTVDKKTGRVRPKKSRAGRKSNVPWEKIELAYISEPNSTSKTLAKKFKISASSIAKRITDYKWVEKRALIDRDATNRAMTKIAARKASEIEEIDGKLMKDLATLHQYTMSRLARYDEAGNQLEGLNMELTPSEVKMLVSTVLDLQKGYYLIVGKPSEIQERRVTEDKTADLAKLRILDSVLTDDVKARMREEYAAFTGGIGQKVIDVGAEDVTE